MPIFYQKSSTKTDGYGMKKSKLIDLLKLLSKSEMRDFERFVESPFYNKDKKLIQFLTMIKRYYPEFESRKLEKEYVASKIFPELKADATRKVNYLMSGLIKLLEDFLVQTEMNIEQVDREYYMLKSLHRRNADKYFYSLFEKTKDRLSQAKQWDMNFFYNQFRINNLAYIHPSTNRYQPHIDSLQESIDNLNLFYAATKLRYSSELMNRQNILAEEYSFPMLDSILQLIDKPPFSNFALFSIYKKIIQLNTKPNKDVYLTLKELILENFNYFDESEKLDLIIYLSNYNILHTRKEEHHSELFDIMKFSLKYDVWVNGGFFIEHAFLNIVTTGSALKEFEWVNKFISQYGPMLKEENRDNTVSLGKATLNFVQKKFDAALDDLKYVEYTDINYNIFVKALTLKCYYELPNYELAFFDYCNSFSQFIRRNKIGSEKKLNPYLNFITFSRRLFKNKTENNLSLEKFEGELNTTTELSYKSWLFEKLDEFQ